MKAHKKFVGNLEVYREMNKKYGPFEVHAFPRRLAEKPSYKNDVLALERRIMDEYKFTLQEMHYLIKNKPSILLLDDDY